MAWEGIIWVIGHDCGISIRGCDRINIGRAEGRASWRAEGRTFDWNSRRRSIRDKDRCCRKSWSNFRLRDRRKSDSLRRDLSSRGGLELIECRKIGLGRVGIIKWIRK